MENILSRFFRKNNIPKIIHYVWVGEKPIKPHTKKYIQTWIAHNPDYKIIFWNDTNINKNTSYLKNAFRLKNYSNVSNFIRLQAIYDHGGIYLDTDIECLKSFDVLLNQPCFFGHCIKEENTDWVNSAAFGAIKHHWFIKEMIFELLKQFDGSEASNLSGPRILTTMLKKYGLSSYNPSGTKIKDIMLYPIEYFYPYNWLEKYSPKYITPNTITVHYWEKRWE